MISEAEIVRGPGPRWLRIALVAVAMLYYAALIWHPAQRPGLRMFTFFSEATKLFTKTIDKTIEYRLSAWSCTGKNWQLIDPRVYFPLEADDKESRFQRLAYFYADLAPDRDAMEALDDFIRAHHAAGEGDDGVRGAIGGIQLSVVRRDVPEPGSEIERYVYRPLEPVPYDPHAILYYTRESRRVQRCAGAT